MRTYLSRLAVVLMVVILLVQVRPAFGESGSRPIEMQIGVINQAHLPQSIEFLLESAVSVSTGEEHTCALTAGGGVKCWGYNSYGQLGDGTTIDRLTPVDVVGLASGVTAISAGMFHSCALTSGGGVKCWGYNPWGQLGDGTTIDRLTPVDVAGLVNGVAAISAGGKHTCALTSSGGAKCWGNNNNGQLGDGTQIQRLTPVNVFGLSSGVSEISAGWSHTCVVTNGGGAKCWGINEGQLGDGTNIDRSTPVDVVGLASGVSDINSGYWHSCALTTGGGAKCWGVNADGRLGDGTTTVRLTPVDVAGLLSGVSAVDAGYTHTCALLTGGGAKCWGGNYYGQLGDGTQIQRLLPVDVAGQTNGVSAISAGGHHTCAVTSSGEVKCWGANYYGQLGDGTTTNQYTPVDVVGFGGGNSCALVNLPLYYQGWPSTPDSLPNKPDWYDDTYGNPVNNPDGDTYNTVGRWGCNTTSNAMIVRLYENCYFTFPTTNPGTLNVWLRNNGGYNINNEVIYSRVVVYAKTLGIGMTISMDGRDDQKMDQHLDAGNPAMVMVQTAIGTHFVAIKGRTQVSGVDTYRINDPIWGDTTLYEHYNNTYSTAYYYTGSKNTSNLSMLQISALSPVHLLVTDPLGRKSGYDPRTDITWDEIPEAGYTTETIAEPDGSTLPETKVLLINHPMEGDYQIEVIGYDSGSYEVEVIKLNHFGDSSEEQFSGTANTGSSDTFMIGYDPGRRVFLPMVNRN